MLKPLDYAAAQFGKNHLGDRNEFPPTVHGFDEWFGNLYHLNAEEEPEQLDYLKDPALREKFAARGVMHAWAKTVDDATTDPRFGRIGKGDKPFNGNELIFWPDGGHAPFRGREGTTWERDGHSIALPFRSRGRPLPSALRGELAGRWPPSVSC